MQILGRFSRVGFLALAVLTSIASSASAAPRQPLPPWPEIYLYQWSFDEPYIMPELLVPTVSAGKRTAETPAWVESWSGYALNRQERQSRVIQLPMKADNGYPMVVNGTGTLRFWFCPNWTSGQGPGQEGRLLEMVTGSGKGSVTWWSMCVNADGTGIKLNAETEKGQAELARGPVQWQAGKWHLIALVYSPTNTVILVDAQVLAEGGSLPEIPTEAQKLSGLIIGSDALGQQTAKGQFDELTTFHYSYPSWLLGTYYRAHRRQAEMGAIQTETGRSGQTTQPTAVVLEDLAPPGGGGGGDTNCLVPWQPVATNGLRLVVASWTNETIGLTILGGQSNAWYDFYTTPALTGTNGSNSTWTMLGSGQNSNTCYFAGQTNPQAVFLLASRQDGDNDGLSDGYEQLISRSQPNNNDSDGDGMPDGWEWWNFGNFAQSATGDYDNDGMSNYSEWQYHNDPNTITWQLRLENTRFSGNTVTGTIEVANGVAVQRAMLVDNTNFATAIWQPLGTNIMATITNEGAHAWWIGVRGRASNEYWQCTTVMRDTTAPALVITNLPNLTVSRPMLHLKGISPEPLASLEYALTNSAGEIRQQQGLINDQYYDLVARTFTTNSFSCLDLALTLGTNYLGIVATDQAGNVTRTNLALVLWTGNDTNAPTITATWPPAGASLSGNSFTMHGRLDDESASIQAFVIDNGTTNVIEGLVERDGKFWLEELPLASGTNTVLITAADYAGNTTTSICTLVKSVVTLTMADVAENQLHQLTVTATGTVSDPAYAVSVNGVSAVVEANGNWIATEVPVNDGNTAEFEIIGQLGTNTVKAGLFQDKPARAFIERYDVAVAQSEHGMSHPASSMPDPHDLGGSLWWQERAGGEKLHSIALSANSTGLLSHTIWPADTYTPTRAGTNYDIFGNQVSAAAPSLALEQCDISGIAMMGTNWWINYARQAHAKVLLATGGKNLPQRNNLFSIGSHVMNRGWFWRYSDWGYATNRGEVAPEKIMLGAFGPLDDNYLTYAGLPDGQRVELTPVAQGIPNQEASLPVVTKYQLHIYRTTAGGGEMDVTGKNQTVWVGEQMALRCAVEPALPAVLAMTNLLWTVPGSNEQRVADYVIAPGLAYSTNVPLTALSSNLLTFYWVDGMTGAVVRCAGRAGINLLTAETTFNVSKPTADWIGSTNGPIQIITNNNTRLISYGFPEYSSSAGMHFVFTNRNLLGYSNNCTFSFAQLMIFHLEYRGTNAAGDHLTIHFGLNDTFGLDMNWPYKNFLSTNHDITFDSPATYLDPTGLAASQLQPLTHLETVSNDLTFRSILFFTPNQPSIPVAIKRIDWNLLMAATNSGSTHGLDRITSGSTATMPTNNATIHGNPVWSWYIDAWEIPGPRQVFTNQW